MINRVLIRIKVVQLLYAYLLVENPFSLESQPSNPTKEKRFAYSLYLDTLLLMVGVAESIQKRGGVRPLYDTRFISRVLSDDKIKGLRRSYTTRDFPLKPLVAPLADEITESGIYKKFMKISDPENADTDNLWKNIFDLIISKNPEFNKLISERENYTLKGVDRMTQMMDDTFTRLFASNDHLPDALKTLKESLGMSRELYFRFLSLPVVLTHIRERQIDDARHKHLQTEEDLNPNMRFVENEFVRALEQDPAFQEGIRETDGRKARTSTKKFDWFAEDPILMRNLLKAITESDVYADYMSFPATDFYTDCEFWRNVFKFIILRNPDFLEALEDRSVFWNDDVDVIGTFTLKTIRRFSEQRPDPVLPMYKDEEDARFGAELFTAVIKKKELYRKMIDDALDRNIWESDRLAFMDVVIMMAAIAEILNFPKIPLEVSLNEYIEIAKSYSTQKSGKFVNGLMSSIVSNLQAEGLLSKS